MTHLKTLIGTVASALFCATLAGGAAAQGFPNRPITFIYPFAGGSAGGESYRLAMLEAGKVLGQTVIYDNKAGGNGRVGFNAMAVSKPDGYMLCLVTQGMVILDGIIDPSLKLEPGKDYAPLTQLVESTLLLTASAGAPYKNLKEMIAYAKANPGKVNVGAVGGSGGVVAVGMLQLVSGANINLVRYKGDVPGVQDVMGGHIQGFVGVSGAAGPLRAGKMIGIAALRGRRSVAEPDIPTAAEQGVQVSVPNWTGAVAPPGTPTDVLNKLADAMNQALALPETKSRMNAAGLDTAGSSPEKFLGFIRGESERLTNVIRQTGIKLTD